MSLKQKNSNDMIHELKMIELKKKHAAELAKAEREISRRAVIMLIPLMSTALHECYGFGEVKQEPCIQKVLDNLRMCTNEGIMEWDEWKEFCEKSGKKCFVEIDEVTDEKIS